MIARGVNLWSCKFWEVVAHARTLITDPTSQLSRWLGSDGFTATEHLLMLAVDELRVSNWMRTKDGHKGRSRPDPISPITKAARKPTTHGGTDLSPAEVIELLKGYGPAESETDDGS